MFTLSALQILPRLSHIIIESEKHIPNLVGLLGGQLLCLLAVIVLLSLLFRSTIGSSNASGAAQSFGGTLNGIIILCGIFAVAAAIVSILAGFLALAIYSIQYDGYESMYNIRRNIDIGVTVLVCLVCPLFMHILFVFGASGEGVFHSIRLAFRKLGRKYLELLATTTAAILLGYVAAKTLTLIPEGIAHEILQIAVYTLLGTLTILFLLSRYSGFKEGLIREATAKNEAGKGGGHSSVAAIVANVTFCRRSGTTFRVCTVCLGMLLFIGFFPNFKAIEAYGAEITRDLPQTVLLEAEEATEEEGNRANLPAEEMPNTLPEKTPSSKEVILSAPILPEGEPEEPGLEISHDRWGRTYRLADGSYLKRIYSEPLTYTDEKGKEKDIDNALVKEGDGYTNTAASYSVSLPKEVEGITIEKDGYSLTINPLNYTLQNAVKQENAIRYNGVLDGVDIQYTALATRVKEDIILTHPIDNPTFSYALEGKGYDYELTHGALNIYDAKEKNSAEREAVFTITAPLMYDAAGEGSQWVYLSLSQDEDGTILTITPDENWLNAPERVYPVTIDPPIQLDASNFEWTVVTNGANSWVNGLYYGGDANTPHTNNSYLYSGFEDGSLVGYTTYGQTRSFLKINYDFSQLMLPQEGFFHATLSMYKIGGAAQPARTVYAKYVTSDWQASIHTWNTQPQNFVTFPNGQDVSGPPRVIMWDISDAVNEWNNGSPNYGIVLAPEVENQAAVCFGGPTNPNNLYQPTLDIYWTVPDAVDENLQLDTPNINLRPLTQTHVSGLQTFNGFFTDGIIRPQLDVYYRLHLTDDLVTNDIFGLYEKAEYGRKYPNSDAFTSSVAFTTGYHSLESNWQSILFSSAVIGLNQEYRVYAYGASAGTAVTSEGESDRFIIYKFSQQDTLPYVANYYGVPLSQIVADNRPQDYLAFPGNTFFIRNPNGNASIPYVRDDNLTVSHMRDLIYANNGRGMLSEFDLEPVNMSTGNFYMETVDVENAEYQGSYQLIRSYNAMGEKSPGLFGYGFTSTLSESLSYTKDGDIRYTTSDGKQIVFTNTGSVYEAPAGYNLALTKNIATSAEYPEMASYEIAEKDGTVRHFNAYGLLTQVTDARGLSEQLTYDASGKIVSLTTKSQKVYQFTTNAIGQITKIRLPNGGTLSYEYMEGFLTVFTDADGGKITYIYDENGQMTAWTDGNGTRQVLNVYDLHGRVAKQTNAAGLVSELTYEDGKTTITEEGKTRIYEFDGSLRITKITDPTGSIVRTYSAENTLASETDREGNTTLYEYDGSGNINKKTRADGAYQTISYDTDGNPITVRDFDGSVTENTYNAFGDLLSSKKPDGSIVTYTYDSEGRTTSITSGEGSTTTFAYPAATQTIMTDANGNVTILYYDAMGLLVNEIDAEGIEHRTVYSASGKKTGVWQTGGYSESYAFDAAGNCTEIIDANGCRSTYAYNGLNKITAATNPTGYTITYGYDKWGNRISETDVEGNSSTFSYDAAGSLIHSTDPLGGEESYTYDSNGNMRSSTDKLGVETSYVFDTILNLPVSVTTPLGTTDYSYDVMGRLIKTEYPDGSEESAAYDGMGRVVKTTNAAGLETTYSYDLDGNRIKSEDNAGRVTSSTFDGCGNLISQTDPIGRTITYAYDGTNRLVAVTGPDGATESYTLDGGGNAVKITQKDGSELLMEYDGAGNMTSYTDAAGNRTQYTYSPLGDILSVTDAEGGVITYEYTSAQLLSAYTKQMGQRTEYVYDEANRLVKSIDPRGNAVEFSYDAAGNVREIQRADGTKSVSAYDEAGQLVSVTDARDLVSETSYDNMGRVTREWDNAGNEMCYEYDSVGRVTKQTDQAGRVMGFEYDLAGNLTQYVDFNGDERTYTYDLAGRALTYKGNDGRVTEFSYDENDNLIETVDASGRSNKYEYDRLSRLTAQEDALEQRTEVSYDQAGNVTQVLYADGTSEAAIYDSVGKTISQADANGHETRYSYDVSGRLTSQTLANGGTYSFRYDENDNIIFMEDPYGSVTSYEYDEMNRMVSKTSPRGGVSSITYNETGDVLSEESAVSGVTSYDYTLSGLLKSKTDPNGLVTTYSYDSVGRIEKITDSTGLSYAASYDAAGNVLTETDNNGAIYSYSYDAMHHITGVTNPLGGKTTLGYSADGNLTSRKTPAGSTTEYAYDALDRVTSIKAVGSAGITYSYDVKGEIAKITQGEREYVFTRDAAGNVLSLVNPLGEIVTFTYDEMGLPLTATDSVGGVSLRSYDLIGRVTEETDALGSVSGFTYDAEGNLSSYTDTEGNITKIGYDLAGNVTSVKDPLGRTATYVYDKTGNLTEKNVAGESTKYDYDLHSNLAQITSPSGKVETFIYDANSRLTQKTLASGTKINYDYDKLGDLLSKDYSEEKGVTYAYAASGLRLSMNDSTGKSSYTYDSEGRIASVTDSYGKMLSYNYDEYGQISQIGYPDGRTVSYAYDLAGRLTMVSDSQGESVYYSYSKKGEVLKAVRSSGVVTDYRYDVLGRLLSLVNSKDGKVLSSFSYTWSTESRILTEEARQDGHISKKSFFYDAAGQLTVIVDDFDGVVTRTSYSWSAFGEKTETVSDKNGKRLSQKLLSYDEDGRLLSETDSVTGEVTSYSYDANGNLVTREDGTSVTSYTYDTENRLKTVREGGALLMAANYNGDGDRVFSVSRELTSYKATYYEKEESLLTVTAVGSVTQPAVNPQEAVSDDNGSEENTVYRNPEDTVFWFGVWNAAIKQSHSITPSLYAPISEWYTSGWQDSISDILGLEKSNKEKNRTRQDEKNMQDAGVTVEDVTTEDVYIPSGTGTVIGTSYELTYYVNDVNRENAMVLAEYTAGDTVKATYLYGNELLAQDTADSKDVTDYLLDGRGSVVQTLSSGNVDTNYYYDPFGVVDEVLSSVTQNDVFYGYNAEEYSQVTGLQYLRARYYMPKTGSFLTQDSVLGDALNLNSQNRYAYAEADPVNKIDPSGHAVVGTAYAQQMEQMGSLNEMRNLVVGAQLQYSQNLATTVFYGYLNSARATDYTNINAINNIAYVSQTTANYYIAYGVVQAYSVCQNYACVPGGIVNTAVSSFASNVEATRSSVNTQIQYVKSYKYTQYQQYQAYLAYLAWVAAQQEAAQKMEAARASSLGRQRMENGIRGSISPLTWSRNTYISNTLKAAVEKTNDIYNQTRNGLLNGMFSWINEELEGYGLRISYSTYKQVAKTNATLNVLFMYQDLSVLEQQYVNTGMDPEMVEAYYEVDVFFLITENVAALAGGIAGASLFSEAGPAASALGGTVTGMLAEKIVHWGNTLLEEPMKEVWYKIKTYPYHIDDDPLHYGGIP
jgi:RHS repeat-associated protein